MKTISFITLLLVTTFVYTQDTLKHNLSNTISGSYVSNTNTISVSWTGNNNLTYKGFGLYNTTSYSEAWTLRIKSLKEISHKTNLTYKKTFLLYMFTQSFTRKIEYDNSAGIGYVHWWKYLSLSYGVLAENTQYTTHTTQVGRHSVRMKTMNKWGTLEYYYQPNIKDYKDYLVTGTTKINLLQGKKYSLTLNDNLNFRSISTTKVIHSTQLGITITL